MIPGDRVSTYIVEQIRKTPYGHRVLLICDCGQETWVKLSDVTSRGPKRCQCRSQVSVPPSAISRLDPCCSDEAWRGLASYGVFISSCGRCFNILQNRPTGTPNGNGYITAYFGGKGSRVPVHLHRLVLLAFVGPSPKHKDQTRHLDGNPSNNHLSNLCWGTPLENAKDKYKHGTVPLGSKHHAAKLTEADIPKIRELCKQGISQKEAGRRFGITRSGVANIVQGRIWKHV